MVEPQTIVAFAPMLAPRHTRVVAYCPRRTICERGLVTLVKTHDGPQKTSSSSSTPSYSETLFCTFTLLPILTPDATSTFWPKMQPSPITASFITWQKC